MAGLGCVRRAVRALRWFFHIERSHAYLDDWTGGRTSCVVPSVQKKTGPVAGDIKSEELDEDSKITQGEDKTTGKRKIVKDERTEPPAKEKEAISNGTKASKKRKSTAEDEQTKTTHGSNGIDAAAKGGSKKRKSASSANASETQARKGNEENASGRRRSARVSRNGA